MPASTTISSSLRRTAYARKSRPIKASTSNCLRLSFGNRSVPPATNIARGPSSDAMCAASRALFGRRYLNRGRRSTIQLLGRRFDFDRRGIWNVGKARRAVTRRLALLFSSQRLDDLLGRDRHFVDPHAQRVEHRGADRGDDRQQGALTRLLRSVWPFRVVGFDDEGLHVGHVEESRRLVLEHRRPLVEPFAERLLLHERLAQSHVHPAF